MNPTSQVAICATDFGVFVRDIGHLSATPASPGDTIVLQTGAGARDVDCSVMRVAAVAVGEVVYLAHGYLELEFRKKQQGPENGVYV